MTGSPGAPPCCLSPHRPQRGAVQGGAGVSFDCFAHGPGCGEAFISTTAHETAPRFRKLPRHQTVTELHGSNRTVHKTNPLVAVFCGWVLRIQSKTNETRLEAPAATASRWRCLTRNRGHRGTDAPGPSKTRRMPSAEDARLGSGEAAPRGQGGLSMSRPSRLPCHLQAPGTVRWPSHLGRLHSGTPPHGHLVFVWSLP